MKSRMSGRRGTVSAEAHDLSFAGDGFLLPRLTIAPTPRSMRLRWERDRPAYSEIEFTEQGDASVRSARFRSCRSRHRGGYAGSIGERRIDGGIPATRLGCNSSRRPRGDGVLPSGSALAGQDPFGVPDLLATQIIEFWQRAEPSIREDALATANGVGLAPLAEWLTDALVRVGAVRDGTNWVDVRTALPARTAQPPFQRGYDLARAVRAELAPRRPRYEFAAEGGDAVPSVELRPPTRRIQGVVAADTPACAMQARGNGERFLQGRALGDYLDRIASQPAILSGLATNQQAQSRAFSAEFLAPSDWLRQRVRRGHVYADEIDELADEVGVSHYVIRHQIANHDLATIAPW